MSDVHHKSRKRHAPAAYSAHSAFHPGAVAARHVRGHAQAHPGVHPLDPLRHRNTGFQPLPEPLGLPPYHYDLATHFADIAHAASQHGKLVLHVVGDSGGVKDAEFQGNVAEHLTGALHQGGPDTPQFCYHVGDVVYFNGEHSAYYDQFYEPYAHYDAPIFAIPGNHDGEVDDPSEGASLQGFVDYFMQAQPDVDPVSKDCPRVGLDLPNVYWTLITPLAYFVGIYTNVPEGGSIDSVQQQWLTHEFATAPKDRALIFSLHHPIYSFDTYHSGSSKMADVLEQAIRDTKRVPNLVLSGHVHNYQRIEQEVAEGVTIPFLVIGNGGYHNLHSIATDDERRGDPTGAVLQYGQKIWGYTTLEITRDKITGFSTEVDRNGKVKPVADQFDYSAHAIVLDDVSKLRTL